jgi:hypothetical protein
MTERLRDNPDDLEALVGLAAEALQIPAIYVEKDFWVTEVLRVASIERTVTLPDGSIAPATFIFKGGTSLSRVFGIIERFSEDVDLLAVFPLKAASGPRHKVLKEVDQAVRSHLALAKPQVVVGPSTTGIKRYTTYLYPRENNHSSLKEGVLLELGSRGGTQPFAVHNFCSLAAEHAINTLGESETAWEEFAAFTVNVLAPERTLFEKLAAVHDAASRNDRDALLKHGRHFYDIHCLLQDKRVTGALEALGSEGIRALVDDIDSQSAAAGFSSTPRPSEGYVLSAAFDRAHPTHGTIESGYKEAQALIYGDTVPLDVVIDTVHHWRELL